jgi:hypothetical protein
MARGQPFKQHGALDGVIDSDNPVTLERIEYFSRFPFVSPIPDNLQHDLLVIALAESEY